MTTDLTDNGSAVFTNPIAPTPQGNSPTRPRPPSSPRRRPGRPAAGLHQSAGGHHRFHTEFTVLLHTGSEPPGEGFTFTMQNQKIQPAHPNYGDTVIKLSPTPAP